MKLGGLPKDTPAGTQEPCALSDTAQGPRIGLLVFVPLPRAHHASQLSVTTPQKAGTLGHISWASLTHPQFTASEKGEQAEKGSEKVYLTQKRLLSVLSPGPGVQRLGGKQTLGWHLWQDESPRGWGHGSQRLKAPNQRSFGRQIVNRLSNLKTKAINTEFTTDSRNTTGLW